MGGLRVDIDRAASVKPPESPIAWSVIALTCGSETDQRAAAYIAELKLRQERGEMPRSTMLLAVPDPGGHSIGSGGATANALVVVAERISAEKQSPFIDAELLADERVLIIHLGPTKQHTTPPFTWSGKAFVNSPAPQGAESESFTSVDALLRQMSRLARNAPHGTWVCSTEAHMVPGEGVFPEDAWHKGGITVLSVPVPLPYAKQHGTYLIGSDSQVRKLMYKASEEYLREAGAIDTDGMVPMVCGVVFLDILAIQVHLLSFNFSLLS